MIPLPIDSWIDRIASDVRRSRAAVITAAPGAGKTTRVPPALLAEGPLILLQPRRVAARAIAARIADERQWALGREVGWQIRFDHRFSDQTRLLVVTEGILTARLQRDPLLSNFCTIVIDEFHERSIHADVALALAKQAWRARDDLRLVVMSATLDAHAVAAYLDDCPIADVSGRLHAIEIAYTPGVTAAAAAVDALAATTGDVLCFLPGAPEIRRTLSAIGSVPGVDLLPLHGSLDADAQDRALRPAAARRIIVATNLAETSLTVPRVTAVIDSGLHKVARYDAARGIDSLDTERIPLDAADQRAGRAGRVAPGIVRRLWDRSDRLRPHREPDIHRVDIASAVLDVIAWGGDPRSFEWFETPRSEALDTALALLSRLGLIDDRMRLTKLGDRVRKLPLHPRLGCILAAGAGRRDVARACAILSERHWLPPRAAATSSDLLSALDEWQMVPPHVQRAADEIARIAHKTIASEIDQSAIQSAIRNPSLDTARDALSPGRRAHSAMTGEAEFRRALFAGYPDRVAQRREPRSANLLMATGTGAILAPESGVHDGEFLIAIDVVATPGDRAAPSDSRKGRVRGHKAAPMNADQPRIRIASIVDREWLTPTTIETVHRMDKSSGTVKGRRIERYDALVLSEHHEAVDADAGAARLAEAWLERGPRDEDERILRRLRFTGHLIDVAETIRRAAHGARRLSDVHLVRALSVALLKDLERNAPDTIKVPSGQRVRLEYGEDGTVSASVKLQELFGLADTPRIGKAHTPVVLHLLSPSGRPVQVTQDLRSFWTNTYPEVRKELRGRYPRHPWPEDPWKATPTARAKPKR